MSLSMASGLRKFWSQLGMNVLFQPSSHLVLEERVRANTQMFTMNEQGQ